jgi:hypothetical protein
MKMLQSTKRYLCVALLAGAVLPAWAFSLLGPAANGPDAYQVPEIGYNPLLIGSTTTIFGPPANGTPLSLTDPNPYGPKNLGEEYRRNIPVIYYAANANFLDYFGSNGVVAVDSAMAVLNNAFTNNPATGQYLTNGVDGLSPGLTEYSVNTASLNYSAQALGLLDVKSTTMSLMMEQLGLADAVRYTWALHDRYQPPGTTCPNSTEYLVIMRNFDITASPLGQIQYSPFINGEFYSYSIIENCDGPGISPPTADAVEGVVDPLYNNPPVASGFGEDDLPPGGFYTGLTRDDVAGLRYLLSANDLNTEAAPAGTSLLLTNVSPPQLITTLPLGQFILQSQTLDPTTLQALYPGLIITETITNYSFSNVATITAYYTNQPGPSVTNYGELQSPPPPINNGGTLDFSLFTLQQLTNTTGGTANSALAIAQLQALYPGLLIQSATAYLTNVVTTNFVIYLTNQIGAPAGSPPKVVTAIGSIVTNRIFRYTYIFQNIMLDVGWTNFQPFVDYTTSRSLYNTNQLVTIQTTYVTNLTGAPVGSPQSTNTVTTQVHRLGVTGDFFIIPTNWCGFIVATQYPPILTVIPSYTNSVVFIGTSNGVGTATATQDTIYTYTNNQVVIRPGVCQPALIFVTNFVGTVFTNYQHTFANVVTNSFFTNSQVTLIVTNIGPCPNGLTNVCTVCPTNSLCTNVVVSTFSTNLPSGDFWIVPAAWSCGYNTNITVVATFTNAVTNILLTATNGAGVADIGQQFTITLISSYTNHSLVVQPFICQTVTNGPALRQGIQKILFIRANYDSLLGQFFQPFTNVFQDIIISNGTAVVQTMQRVVTTPDVLFSAADLASGPAAIPRNTAIGRNVNFDQTTIYPGLAGPGTITPSSTITFDKVGPVYANTSPFSLNGPIYGQSFLWGSFDGTTNDPVVYPNGTSIANLAAEVLIQIFPASLPNGTNGVAYPTVTLSVTGGQAPYVWSLPAGTSMPPGLNLSPGGVISGTPTQSGTFIVTIQLNDAANRSVAVNYTIIIN